nr:putative atpase n2b [Quercus suber]
MRTPCLQHLRGRYSGVRSIGCVDSGENSKDGRGYRLLGFLIVLPSDVLKGCRSLNYRPEVSLDCCHDVRATTTLQLFESETSAIAYTSATLIEQGWRAPMSANIASSTSLAITNPLVKYRALVATKRLIQDPAQVRLALHLQKLYEELKDYEPEIQYSQRLDQISRAVRQQNSKNPSSSTQHASSSSSAPKQSTWRSLLAAKQKRDSLALTRRLTSHEEALQLTSPRGLMLHGEVGTGKSMLVDLFADCLPHRKKKRWHFNTFMLETLAKLEALRRARGSHDASAAAADQDDYSLLWLAKDMVQTSPILFLDEFQMPDRAASKILTNLMTSFFHLGGVLVATSNRMPEELAKAAGIQFGAPPQAEKKGALGWQFGMRRSVSVSDRLFAGQNEFAAFLEVLKARCEVWEMEGGKDYRRLESGGAKSQSESASFDAEENSRVDQVVEALQEEAEKTEAVKLPLYFDAQTEEHTSQSALAGAIASATGASQPDLVDWKPEIMRVYGRATPVPRACNGVSMWTFDELCRTTLGPADYITLASTYHTLILTDVPVLTWLMKNEARRFITLLDALYECRCKLFVSAQAGPDDLFFPEKTRTDDEQGESIYSETLSEVYQDATAPFRPNILSQNPNYAEPELEPDYTHARLAGMLNADALEDDPPNKVRRNPFGRSFGLVDSEFERKPIDPDEPSRYTPGPDFGKTSAFTGEDERFAYRRAQSRLWEICGARWWARDEADWHRPLPQEVRRWERDAHTAGPTDMAPTTSSSSAPDATIGDSTIDETRDERSFRHVHNNNSTSPFRTAAEPPPKFSWTHFWGTMKWGPKAGAWGQGPEGLEKRGNEKR